MGDVCDGVFQLRVPLLEAAALGAESPELYIDGPGQAAHMSVPAGNVDQGVGICLQPVGKALPDFLRGFLQHMNFDQQGNDDQRQNANQGP